MSVCSLFTPLFGAKCSNISGAVAAPGKLGQRFPQPSSPGDGLCPSRVLCTLGRVKVFFFSGASRCWARGGLGTELCLSIPQVPLKMFPQLLLPLQLWVLWQVPGQVLILVINVLLLIQVHILQPVPIPLPLAPQEE